MKQCGDCIHWVQPDMRRAAVCAMGIVDGPIDRAQSASRCSYHTTQTYLDARIEAATTAEREDPAPAWVSGETYAALLERCIVLESTTKRKRPKLDPNVPFKVCTKCSETKPRSAFQRHSSHSDGLRSRCRECEKPREKARKRDRAAWRAAHPDYMKQWRAAHPEKQKEYDQRRRAKKQGQTPHLDEERQAA